MENTCRGVVFGKSADPQPAILSKKCTPMQISFNLFVCILGAPPSKQTSKKKSNNFEIYCMLYCCSFSAVEARSFRSF